MTACATNIVLGWAFRLFYSNDGYVWTAYNAQQLSDADLGEIFHRDGNTTYVELNPSIRVRYI